MTHSLLIHPTDLIIVQGSLRGEFPEQSTVLIAQVCLGPVLEVLEETGQCHGWILGQGQVRQFVGQEHHVPVMVEPFGQRVPGQEQGQPLASDILGDVQVATQLPPECFHGKERRDKD